VCRDGSQERQQRWWQCHCLFVAALPPRCTTASHSQGTRCKVSQQRAPAQPRQTPTRRHQAQASLSLCVLMLCVSHWKAASKLLSAALSKYGPQSVLRVLLAVWHAAQGERTEARTILQALPPLDQLEPRAFNMLVHCYRIMDDGQSWGTLLPPLVSSLSVPLPTLGSSHFTQWALNSKIG